MNILKYIKNLYTGSENLIIQLSIFALCGVMAISFNETFAAYTGGSIYAVFASPENNMAILYTLLGFTIFIYLTGYSYRFVNGLFNEENKVQLPSISLNCFTTFLKVFPVMFVWGIYIAILSGVGLFLTKNVILFFIWSLLILILLPFINLIFIRFAKDFKYTKEIFNPLTLLKFIDKSFMSVILFLIQFIIGAAIISALIGFGTRFAINLQSRNAQLIGLLSIICIGAYLEQMLNFAYYQGMTKIAKDKILD